MSKYAVIIGEAPEGFRMKKTEEMVDFLTTTEGGAFPRSNVIGFPNGIDELTLEAFISRLLTPDTKSIFMYICTKLPVKNTETSIWLNGDELRRDVIAEFQNQAKDLDIDFQLIFDTCSELLTEEELGYEKV